MKIYINHIFSNVIMLWYCSAICISNVHWHSVHKIMYISTAQKRCGQFDQNQFDDKEKLCIIIFSYLHLLPETQSLECSFSDLKNLVLKDEMKCEKTFIGQFTHPWLSWSIKKQNKPCDIRGPYYAVTPVQMMGPVSAGDLLRAKCRALFPSPHPGCCLHLLAIRITTRGEKYTNIKSSPDEVNMRPTSRVDIWWHQWNMRWWNVFLTAV